VEITPKGMFSRGKSELAGTLTKDMTGAGGETLEDKRFLNNFTRSEKGTKMNEP
jgi:deoxyadenosine/deoxycytidine kinase